MTTMTNNDDTLQLPNTIIATASLAKTSTKKKTEEKNNCVLTISSDRPPTTKPAETETEIVTTQQNTKTIEEEWNTALTEFNRAIRDVTSDFNQWHWMQKLFKTGMQYVLYKITTRIGVSPKLIKKKMGHLLHMIPCFSICLICFVSLCYFTTLHDSVIVKRWCHCFSENNNNGIEPQPQQYCQKQNETYCWWSTIHATIAIYLTIMILCNYSLTVFTSPGVALPPPFRDTTDNNQEEEQKESNNIVDSLINNTATCSKTSINRRPTNDIYEQSLLWKSYYKSRGGCCYVHSNLNAKKEHDRVLSFYKYNNSNAKEEDWSCTENIVYLPSPNKSYCKRCFMHRPARCHHCSWCNRCVLQMDHHCLWMNNCIGYNNYRYFLLSLFYLIIGCCYGLLLFIVPYYEIMKEQILLKKHGTDWRFSFSALQYLNLDLFKDALSAILSILQMFLRNILRLVTTSSPIISEEEQNEVTIGIIKMIVPLFLFVSIALSILFQSHLKFFFGKGFTTLEYSAFLQIEVSDAFQDLQDKLKTSKTKKKEVRILNPFHQGVVMNFQQIFGVRKGGGIGWSILSVFLPICVSPPIPYIPTFQNAQI